MKGTNFQHKNIRPKNNCLVENIDYYLADANNNDGYNIECPIILSKYQNLIVQKKSGINY